MKHSPGPWKVAPTQAREIISPRCIVARPVLDQAWSPCGPETEEEVDANVRLMVAAPDLLAALEAVLPHVPGYTTNDIVGRPWLAAAMDAISKAKPKA